MVAGHSVAAGEGGGPLPDYAGNKANAQAAKAEAQTKDSSGANRVSPKNANPNPAVAGCEGPCRQKDDPSTFQQLKSGYAGERSVMAPPETGAETVGRYTRNTVDFGVNFLPGSSLPDVGTAAGQGSYGTAAVLLGLEFLGGFGKSIKAIAGLEKAAAMDVVKYEVGTFDALKARSVKGDGLDIHHAMQSNPAGQAVGNYNPLTAPAIALPRGEHVSIPTLKGEYNGSARGLLAKDIRDLRNRTNAPNSALRELIDLNKKTYPNSLTK